MAANLLSLRLSGIYASSAPISTRPDPSRRGPSSSPWWTPLFGWSSVPDYIDSNGASSASSSSSSSRKIDIKMESGPDPNRNKASSSRLGPGGFTEEKAKQLRMMTRDTGSFHDTMYHSAIASRLASDFGQGQPEL